MSSPPEPVELLQQLIRFDTSNPPGNERLACDFLGEILRREGIAYDLYDAGNDRVSLRAVLKGDGSKRPFMLLNHTDVVPVQREFWDEDPFSGLVKDGFIWGRGTLDTVARMPQGWLLASLAGVALGVLVGASATARAWLQPMLEFIRPLPASAVLPLAIALFGLSPRMVLVVVAFGAMWPVLLATVHGLATVDARLAEVWGGK